MNLNELSEAVRRRRKSQRVETPEAGLATEAVIKLRLDHLEKQLDELKGRVNGLLFTIVGAVGVQIALRVMG
ncbi:MAG: hypothetical protein FJ320_11260 [SAR202 cluster bacterium]|nr:hypothetical protein [SAR202 cluster bacterium]